MKTHATFGPSLALSVLLNLALFSALQPIRVEPSVPSTTRHRLHRLQRVTVTEPTEALAAVAAPVTRVALQPPPRSTTSPTPPRRTVPAATRAGRAPRTTAPGPEGRAPGPRFGPPQPGPSGGDGTRQLPTEIGGGGDPLPARALEIGDGSGGETLQPALAGLGRPAGPPPRGAAFPTDGPPVILAGWGDRGGTPTAPQLGLDPLPGTAGSGDNPAGLAPATLAGYTAPLAPTTPGPVLRSKPGPGLPAVIGAPVVIKAMPLDPSGTSGGGGGTGATPGYGGGGPALTPATLNRRAADGGGGSGQATGGPRPGGVELGTGPGGTGGGGNGLAPLGSGLIGQPDGRSLEPVAVAGAPSVVTQPGRGGGAGPVVRPGKPVPGPGGEPGQMAPAPAPVTKPELLAASPGPGRGTQGDGPGGGGAAAAVSRGSSGASGLTGAVIDSLGLDWHHRPGSYDLRIGSIDGPYLATVGVLHYRSVASARRSERVQRGGRTDILVIQPLAIEFVAVEGQGARQRVAISPADAQRLKESGLLEEAGRILTVYRDNF